MEKVTMFKVFGSHDGKEYLLGTISGECNAAIFAKAMMQSYVNVRIVKGITTKIS